MSSVKTPRADDEDDLRRELFDDDGTSAVYGTGMIIVQGPSEPDVTYSLSLAGMTEPEELRKRRAAEEGPAEASLETGQWALLTTEQEVSDRLLCWCTRVCGAR